MVLLDVIINPPGSEKCWVFLQLLAVVGMQGRGGVLYPMWVKRQSCRGGPTGRAQGWIIPPATGVLGTDAKALLRSLCSVDFSSLRGFSSLAKEVRES